MDKVCIYEHAGEPGNVSYSPSRIKPTVGSLYYSVYLQRKDDSNPLILVKGAEFEENHTHHCCRIAFLEPGDRLMVEVSKDHLMFRVSGPF